MKTSSSNKFLLAILFIALSFTPLIAQDAFNIVYGPYLQAVSANEATIVWVTNKPASSWVEIAPDDNFHFYAQDRPKYYDTLFGKKKVGTLHKVTINGLNPATNYRYRILSKEVKVVEPYYVEYGRVASTDVYTKKPLKFKTLDDKADKVSFGVVNDIHGDNDLLKSLLSGLKSNDNNFYIYNGDMVSHLDSEKQLFDGFITTSINEFASEKPFYMVRGNHETRGDFSTEFINYFPSTTQNPYYAFKQGPCFFLVLDGGEDKPDTSIEYYDLADFDNYRSNEVAWIKEVVESDDFKNAKYRIVLIHVPPVKSTWHGPLDVKEKFLPVLNNANIDVMFCAHLHSYQYVEKGNENLNFPMIVNSNTEALKVNADNSSLKVDVIDKTGKILKSFEYKASK
ncbi:MAG: FN3 domain-containing metallophosphoesterase family protein [Bacteroidales bacterium]|nr:FN3 domain-containing metallophosphoesterase family protein [Bacteroidales bacterium]